MEAMYHKQTPLQSIEVTCITTCQPHALQSIEVTCITTCQLHADLSQDKI